MLISLAIFLLACAGYFRLRRTRISPENRKYTDYVFGLSALLFTLGTDTLTTVLSVALVYYLYTHYKKSMQHVEASPTLPPLDAKSDSST